MPKCPDCRDVELEVIDFISDKDYGSIPVEIPVYKCPVCKTEFDADNLENEDE